jgi:hypothetical protein
MPGWQVVEARLTARQIGLGAFISCQDEYSLIMRDIERCSAMLQVRSVK